MNCNLEKVKVELVKVNPFLLLPFLSLTQISIFTEKMNTKNVIKNAILKLFYL